MNNRRRLGRKYRSLLIAGMLACGSSGCDLADDPAYLFARGVGSGVLDGLVSLTLDLIGETIGEALAPAFDGDAPE